MKIDVSNPRGAGVVAGGILAFCAIVYAGLPLLASAERAAESAAAPHIERARRILHQYNADLAYGSLVLDQIEDLEMDAPNAEALAEDAADSYKDEHGRLWKAFAPRDIQDGGGRQARAAYNNLVGQIRDGQSGRKELIARNAKLLDEALAEIGLALEATSGQDASLIRSDALRLQGAAFHHKGAAERTKAAVKRTESAAIRERLDGMAREASSLQSKRNLVEQSGIDAQVARVKERLKEVEGELANRQEQLADWDRIIGDTEGKLAAAKSRRDHSRQALERLTAEGVDFSRPDGGAAFAAELLKHDEAFRTADREAQTIESGSLPQARIDATGDFLYGRYVEGGSSENLTVEFGLTHARFERDVLAKWVEGKRAEADGFRADLAVLEAVRAAATTSDSEAASQLDAIKRTAAESLEKLRTADADALKSEDSALKLFDQAASAAQQAAGAKEQGLRKAGDLAGALSPESKERSAANQLAQTESSLGFVSASQADARIAKAWIYYDRMVTASANASLLKSAAALELPYAEAAAESEISDAARKSGVEEIQKAMDILTKAHQKGGKHWTIVAQGAGATYLMTLFGYPDYLPDAVAAYRNAVKGRETERFAESFNTRLKRLENR